MHCARALLFWYGFIGEVYNKYCSNKNIQSGIFPICKTIKSHIYWKDCQDIDGLENERPIDGRLYERVAHYTEII